jgi:hypothetical protein
MPEIRALTKRTKAQTVREFIQWYNQAVQQVGQQGAHAEM